MSDTPGWYDNAERMYIATLKMVGRVLRSPLAYVLAFALISWVGYVQDVPILEEVVQALLALKDMIVPGAAS